MATPRDHTVPQMYLRRFAEGQKQKAYLMAAKVAAFDSRFKTNVANVAAPSAYYTFTDLDGVERRDLERLFGRIESMAVPAFSRILDDPTFALPPEWPLRPELRRNLAWFMAAQIVRTTRQRRRLEVQDAPPLEAPGPVDEHDLATAHARFVLQAMSRVAYGLSIRPWAVLHSAACLVTSDCPVVLMEDHDAENQVAAATMSGLLFPLDPHRAIFMPPPWAVEDNGAKRVDHMINAGGVGTAFTQTAVDGAYEYVFMHPQHVPGRWLRTEGRYSLPGEPSRDHGFTIEYAPMHPDTNIAKRWATEHPQPKPTRT